MPITINGNGAISGLGDIDGHDLETATLVVSGDTTIAPQAVGRASLFIDDSANTVGINTTTPSTLLEIQGKGDKQVLRLTNPSTTDTAIVFNDSSNTTGNAVQLGSKSGEFQFVTNQLERLRIASDGNIGIWNTNPESLLDIRPGVVGTINSITMGYGRTANPTDAIHKIRWTSDDLLFEADTANTIASNIRFNNDGTECMRIDSSGKVGIGETSIQSTLHVAKNIADSDAISWTNSQLSVATPIAGNNTANRATIYFAPYGSDNNYAPSAISATAGTNGASTLKFFTNASGNLTGQIQSYERMRLDSSGRMGLGTNDPKLVLSVNTYGGFDGDANQLLFANNVYYDSGNKAIKAGYSQRIDLNNQTGHIRFLGTTSSASAAGDAVALNEWLRIDNSGNVGLGITTPTSQSGKVLHIRGNDGGQTRIHLTTSASGDGANDGAYIIAQGVESGASAGQLSFTNLENKDIVFGTGSTYSEKLRIQHAGGISFNGDTAQANALDSYEEGTWTPVYSQGVSGATYSNTSGNYTKIGNLVTFTGRIQATAGTNVGSQQLMISGLPYASGSGPMEGGAFFNFRGSLNTSTTSSAGPFLHITKAESRIKFYSLSGNNWVGSDGAGAIGQTLHFQGYYFV